MISLCVELIEICESKNFVYLLERMKEKRKKKSGNEIIE